MSIENGIEVLKKAIKTLPLKPGVYRMLDEKGEVLYVGKAKALPKRVLSYMHVDKLPNRLKRMVSQTKQLEVVVTATETEALLLESNLIKKLRPPYNILLKDDKSFPYILLSKDHEFPRLSKYRGEQKAPGTYFGPFASGEAVEEAILGVQKIFQLRTCTDSMFASRKRPCLQYYIKRCSGPCAGKISEQNYKESLTQAKEFLKGETDAIQKVLSKHMEEASARLDFERAKEYRDRIQLLTHIQSHQRINVAELREADVIGIFSAHGKACVQVFFFRYGRNLGNLPFFFDLSEGEGDGPILKAFITQFYIEHTPPPLILINKEPEDFSLLKEAFSENFGKAIQWSLPKLGKKAEVVEHVILNAQQALERRLMEKASYQKIFLEMQNLFHLSALPERIEAYDNSHLQGTNAYGVMVVATLEGFEKKSYRKFAMDSYKGDDYGMMSDMIRRRFQHSEWTFPDLLLIDGGLGQLHAVEAVMKDLNLQIPVVAIAKGPDRTPGLERFFQEGREPFTLPQNNVLFYFLQKLRDEAHRFAITTHRSSRSKALKKSALDDIPGIGPTRKKNLLQHFGSAQKVAQAALLDLEVVPGISRDIAQKIYSYFHER